MAKGPRYYPRSDDEEPEYLGWCLVRIVPRGCNVHLQLLCMSPLIRFHWLMEMRMELTCIPAANLVSGNQRCLGHPVWHRQPSQPRRLGHFCDYWRRSCLGHWILHADTTHFLNYHDHCLGCPEHPARRLDNWLLVWLPSPAERRRGNRCPECHAGSPSRRSR